MGRYTQENTDNAYLESTVCSRISIKVILKDIPNSKFDSPEMLR